MRVFLLFGLTFKRSGYGLKDRLILRLEYILQRAFACAIPVLHELHAGYPRDKRHCAKSEPPRVYRRVKLSKDEPMEKKKSPPKYTAEFRARGVRLYKDHRADYASDNAAYHAIAPKLGCSPDSLRVWCQQAERDAGERDGLTSEQKARLKALERENKELRTANEILKKASAYFAQAELDRPFRK